MQEFQIEIKEELSRVETIKAETLGDAIDKAMELYYGQKIILDAEDMKEVEAGDITFKKSVRLSRECYILLRLARKIKAEEHKTYQNGNCYKFEVALDKDELKLFKEMFNGKVK